MTVLGLFSQFLHETCIVGTHQKYLCVLMSTDNIHFISELSPSTP